MSEALRGFVLLLSVLLWLPALRPFLDGQMGTDEAALRYAGALLLSWGGVSLLRAVISAYTPEPEPEPTAVPGPRSAAADAPAEEPPASDDPAGDPLADGAPRRRTDDLAR
jgi:hypothetical protein